MIHLEFSFMSLFYDTGKITTDAYKEVKELGVEYEFSKGIPMSDSIYFFNCKNIPENLPSYITIKELSDLYNHYK